MKKFIRWLDINIEPVMMVFLFYTMTGLLTTEVIFRYIFESGFSWSEEISRFLFVWLMYFSISYATRNQRHIRMNFLLQFFNEKIKKIFMIAVDLLFLLFSAVLLKSTINIVQSVLEFGDKAISVNLSMNFLYGAGLVGFVFITARVFQGIVWKIKNFNEAMERFENLGGIYNGANQICFMTEKEEA